ncbi:MAG: riboflavin biosynthesis protein RibF [Candidatus Aminicenantes bacterium]|nr:riboflavin biosynthesis protein RibF [Candidatus Aminicenantes bacterium]
MEVVRSWGAFRPPPPAGCAVALGNFDGLHRGHRRILRQLTLEAARRRLPAYVLTFTPHPEKFFGSSRILMIQTLEQRLAGLARFNLDGVIVAPFRRALASLPPWGFVRSVLRGRLRARLVVVGADFRFGRGRRGDADGLARMGRRAGFEVRAVPHLRRRGRIVSSSFIRACLAEGDIGLANDFLGRPYAIEGDVVAGSGRGRGMGFATANIETPNEIVPQGVYLTSLRLGGADRPSVTNVGLRPTFGPSRPAIETHILDWEGDLYGASVGLAFLVKLREERVFSGPEALAAQIRRDIEAARRFFGRGRRL